MKFPKQKTKIAAKLRLRTNAQNIWDINVLIDRVDHTSDDGTIKRIDYQNGSSEWRILEPTTMEFVLHRENGPARIHSNGCCEYMTFGVLHRLDGPAIIGEDRREYYVNGKRHRSDGPAVIHDNGNKSWLQFGVRHRENGPAVERIDGSKRWYRFGALHRENGPAVIISNGAQQYWINNLPYSPGSDYEEALKLWIINSVLEQ